MKLTSRSEYALLAMVFLARQPEDKVCKTDLIAKEQNIPVKFLEQILLILKRGGMVKSTKGMRGGYRLAKPADQIFLAQIIRLFDGALAPTDSVSKYFYESTPIESEKSLLKVFKEIRDQIAEKLEGTSLADVT